MRGEELDPLPPLGYSPYFSAKNRGRAWLRVVVFERGELGPPPAQAPRPPIFVSLRFTKTEGELAARGF